MYILGINAYHGDVSAVLLHDGDLVAALEEERFRRIKHVAGFPTNAIQRCLDLGGIDAADLDHVAISRDPSAHFGKKVQFVLTNRPSLKLVWERAMSSRKVTNVEADLADALGVTQAKLPPLHNVEHHPAHLASAFFVSPYEEAAVCALDAMGDFVSTSWAIGQGNHMEPLDRVYYPHSLGLLYTAITQFLGFPYYGDEYKVMGLAPYGKPTYTDEIRELIPLGKDGQFELSLGYFRHWQEDYDMNWEEGRPDFGKIYTPQLEDLLGPEREPESELTQRHKDIAHSLQAVHEENAFHVLNAVHEQTGADRLCLAGGVAMNSVANGKVRANTPFEEVYIQPAAADNGTALGAAFHVWHEEFDAPRSFVMNHTLWGTEYSDDRVPEIVADQPDAASKYQWTTYDDLDRLCEKTAQLLADGKVVGWFRGRMEWGARALGNRSILADPGRADARDRINNRVKYREEFRPFAPSILEEAVDAYFDGYDTLESNNVGATPRPEGGSSLRAAPDPFMQQVYPVREEKQDEIPAVTHVDGTGRLQAVGKDRNPAYHTLISAFAEKTGTPVVLNTSFNENEPIVESPEQALDCFFRTAMDAVVVENTLVQRQPVEAAA
ncbi:carbamoyltransferase [Salinibacter ruber]|uniref:carbamoyltransferase family protein n=1 Tax=Salinibacter ruber TaxID=146919 RepID=UPI00216937B5|nr:carbamoyltransferase C-terminal domain-containing protein [Salinibacter ruber]MCS3657984.1 carbamoyltransferase [Salinibacter ruber]MCS4169859.1 carbamoyltransferase [Salinibacter ruber]